MRKLAKHFWDKLGIFVTSLCALHCLFLPLLLPILSLLGLSFFASTWFEHSVLAVSMVVGSYALWTGYRHQHGRRFPFIILAAGGVVYACKNQFGLNIEPILVFLGALLIVLAHVLNIRLGRKDSCEAMCTVH